MMLEGLDEEGCVEEPGYHSEKKRRLCVDQVKALEKSFEVENKLEPERKVKLAQELGLQPRQVAVWFQNRRARWKTKQLERDYGVLKANYEALKVNFDALNQNNEELHKQVEYKIEFEEKYVIVRCFYFSCKIWLFFITPSQIEAWRQIQFCLHTNQTYVFLLKLHLGGYKVYIWFSVVKD